MSELQCGPDFVGKTVHQKFKILPTIQNHIHSIKNFYVKRNKYFKPNSVRILEDNLCWTLQVLLPTQKTIWVVGFPGLLENLFSHGKHIKQVLVSQKSNLMQFKMLRIWFYRYGPNMQIYTRQQRLIQQYLCYNCSGLEIHSYQLRCIHKD